MFFLLLVVPTLQSPIIWEEGEGSGTSPIMEVITSPSVWEMEGSTEERVMETTTTIAREETTMGVEMTSIMVGIVEATTVEKASLPEIEVTYVEKEVASTVEKETTSTVKTQEKVSKKSVKSLHELMSEVALCLALITLSALLVIVMIIIMIVIMIVMCCKQHPRNVIKLDRIQHSDVIELKRIQHSDKTE